METKCNACGNSFLVKPSVLKKGGGRYCSNNCRYHPSVLLFYTKLSEVKENGCIEWTDRLNKDGYGKRIVNGLSVRAHREAYEIVNGKIPDGMKVLHSCDNRKCVNPKHLFLGTDDDNMKDKVRKGRQARGEKNGRSRFSDKQVLEIRDMYKNGSKQVDIAKIFNTSQGAISNIIVGRSRSFINGNC